MKAALIAFVYATASAFAFNFASGNNGLVEWASGCDWTAGDIANVLTTGANCGLSCVNYSGCSKFTWTDYNGGTCWLKSSSATGPVANSGTGTVCGYTTATTIGKKGYSYTASYSSEGSLDANWFYAWSVGAPSGNPNTVPFVPMIWGAGDVTSANINALTISGTATVDDVLLGFNEPDSSSQSNMAVSQAISLWPQLMSTGRRLGSPAVAVYSNGWLDSFMSQIKANNYRVDFITIHYYPEPAYASALLSEIDQIYSTYGLPIWVTEFAPADWSASASSPAPYTQTDAINFINGVIPGLNSRSYVERYAYFSGSISDPQLGFGALFNADGSLTSVGELYQTMIAAYESVNLFQGFDPLVTACALDFSRAAEIPNSFAASSECVWNSVYHFHAVYLSFVHIMFFVLLNCCLQDSIQESFDDEGKIGLFINWHNYTTIPFPVLFANMFAILGMRKYVDLVSSFDEWSEHISDAFWILLRVLAIGNILFNFVLFYLFVQSDREVSLLESLRVKALQAIRRDDGFEDLEGGERKTVL
ncbi:hypothetical protein HK100_011131 [Physocladia obscura]|uniref:Asl1-like glycosyl hydrolase catalytic domain-containing protein n=1 Tax=Physocladia obscura TaxID=109957 RepID=A0AAD5T330_9FUNG|nr:hypothetical protein HK100_011131 [Physocladia obscura]